VRILYTELNSLYLNMWLSIFTGFASAAVACRRLCLKMVVLWRPF